MAGDTLQSKAKQTLTLVQIAPPIYPWTRLHLVHPSIHIPVHQPVHGPIHPSLPLLFPSFVPDISAESSLCLPSLNFLAPVKKSDVIFKYIFNR